MVDVHSASFVSLSTTVKGAYDMSLKSIVL